MSTQTSIEWTDVSWNPVRGCSLVSAGCANCYAMKQAHRFSGAGKPYDGLTKLGPQGPRWTGKIQLVEEVLDAPLHWKKPRRIFVNSMSDLFHEDVPDAFIEKVFTVMAHAQWMNGHRFQVLTKRPERMKQVLESIGKGIEEQRKGTVNPDGSRNYQMTFTFPLQNIWLGVSVEDQAMADERIPILLKTPAAVRWVSAEPLLGPVSFRWAKWDNWKDGQGNERPVVDQHDGLRMLDWVVVGGESGPGARPCDMAWIRWIKDQCQSAGVPVFVKQLGAKPLIGYYEAQDWCDDHGWEFDSDGEWKLDNWDTRDGQPPTSAKVNLPLKDKKGGDMTEWPADLRVREWPR